MATTPSAVGTELIALINKAVSESEGRIIAHIDQKLNAIMQAESAEIKNLIQTQTVETQAKVAQLGIKMADIAKAMTPEKRPAKIKAADAPAAAGGEAAANATPAGEKPAANSMIHFKRMYLADEAFRNHAHDEIVKFSPDALTKMNADATIKKANGDEKTKKQASFMWTILKESSETSGKAYFAEVGQHFKAAKDKYELANKPVQQVAEPNTPTK